MSLRENRFIWEDGDTVVVSQPESSDNADSKGSQAVESFTPSNEVDAGETTPTKPAYVSLNLSREATPQLQAVCDAIKPHLGAVIEWQDPATYHLTLCYIDNVPDAVLHEVIAELPNCPSALQASGIGTFDNKGDGYPVHLVIDPSHALMTVQSAVYNAFAKRGLPISPYSHPDNYHPHVTLCYTAQPPHGLIIEPLTLPVEVLQLSRDNYRTVYESKAYKAADNLPYPLPPSPSGGEGDDETKAYKAADKPVQEPFATPEEYERYWKRFDSLKDEIRHDWLKDYMAQAGPEVLAHFGKLGHAITSEEVQHILSKHHEALIQNWIRTLDAPGPLLAIVLAGYAAGQDTLETGKTAKPTAAKAMPLVVDWNLLSRQALEFVQRYSFDLIERIDATTADMVRDSVADGLQQGMSRDQIAESLQGIFNDPNRARLIAQSESIRSFNAGAFARWSDAGVSKGKWRTVNDPEVCLVCRRLNGQVADISVGWTDPDTGKVYRELAHPGCRCPKAPVL